MNVQKRTDEELRNVIKEQGKVLYITAKKLKERGNENNKLNMEIAHLKQEIARLEKEIFMLKKKRR